MRTPGSSSARESRIKVAILMRRYAAASLGVRSRLFVIRCVLLCCGLTSMPARFQKIANNVSPSKGVSLFGKGALETDFKTWKVLFEARMDADIEARESRIVLERMGCKTGDLELLLYLICVGLEDKFWEDSWEAVERSVQLQKASRKTEDANVLIQPRTIKGT